MAKMNLNKLMKEDQGGSITAEYVIFVAAIGIILAAGTTILFNGMSNLFSSWAGYFGGSSAG